MADHDRRTTTSTPPGSPGTHTTVETSRRRGTPSAIWLVLGAVLAVLVLLYLFNGGLNFAGGADDGGDVTNVTVEGGATDAVEGAADAVAVPDGTDAEVAPATEAPAN